jgi:hypothetical protein
MKKNENDDLLLEIICQKVPTNLNELKGGCFYLTSENVTADELGKALGKSTSEIIAFF